MIIYFGYLFISLPVAAAVALIALLMGGDVVKSFAITYGVLLVIGGVVSVILPNAKSEIETSGEIMTALWAINASLGHTAEKEIQAEVSYQPYLSKNDGLYKYKPGCSIETIQAMAERIAARQGVRIGNLAEATCRDALKRQT